MANGVSGGAAIERGGGVPAPGAQGAARRWTEAQQQAIEIRGKDTLVSAGAGSGKTSVLVERLIRRLLDPVDPVDVDRILVVTFTESAAAEMKERIRHALIQAEAGEHGRRAAAQLALLGKAAISTLHSFCLQVVRRHFDVLGLDPRAQILGEEESRLLKLACLDDVFEWLHTEAEREGGGWASLVENYGGARDDGSLREIVLQLYEYAQSLPDGEAWLAEAVRAYEGTGAAGEGWVHAWSGALCRAALRAVEQARAALDAARRLAQLPGGPATYVGSFDQAAAGLADAAAALRTGEWDRACRALAAVDWPRLAAPRDADTALQAEARRLWDGAKELVNGWARGAFARPLAEYIAELETLRPVVAHVCELVRRFEGAYREAKRRQRVMDFTDLERLALAVLEAEEGRYARAYRERFDEVMVDEYQDINPVQDRLLTLVSRAQGERPNRFMVGDVKQSIYRFRLADPSIFQEKYHAFGRGDGAAARIDLQANFRSHPHILAAVNFLFRQVMHRGTGGIHYGPDVFLQSGRPPGETGAKPGAWAGEASHRAVHLHLIERSEEKGATPGLTSAEREALLVGNLIKALAADPDRPYRFREIAVLMRSPKGRAGTFVETLERLGIPAYTQAGAGFLRAVEVDVMMSLLRLIDNARQDIPLAAVLRSPLVGLTSEELARVRLALPGAPFADAVAAAARQETPLGRRLARFLERLDAWRTSARRLPLSRLVRRIYDETHYVDFVAGLPRGAQREANLWGLYRRAQQFDHFRTEGLDRFLRFVDELTEAGEELAPPPALGEGEDVVQVMSVHQSKGLEFPVVFLVDLDRRFNRADTRRSVIFHRRLGIGAAVIDRARHVRYPSLPHRAVAEELDQDALEEEMRLLYVAATRAKERMFWVASARNLADRCAAWAQSARVEGWELPAGDVLGASSWLDWIGRAVARHRDGAPLRALGAGDLGPDFYRPADPEVFADPAAFVVTLWSGAEFERFSREGLPREAPPLPLDAMGRRVPLDVRLSEERRQELERRYGWRYAFDAVRLPAKVSVTEFARLQAAGEDDEAEEATAGVLLRPLPRFAGERARPVVTPAERGSATHKLLAVLDVAQGTDVDSIVRQVRRLVDAELIAPEHAAAVDVGAVARFFATPLGRRVAAALAAERQAGGAAAPGVRVWRELPFTMLVDAEFVRSGLGAEAAGRGPGGGGEGGRNDPERVVLQGTIDCLVREGDRCLLIDYKTDRTEPGGEARLADRYGRQIALYADFVRRILPDVPVEAYLVFLHSGRILPVAV